MSSLTAMVGCAALLAGFSSSQLRVSTTVPDVRFGDDIKVTVTWENRGETDIQSRYPFPQVTISKAGVPSARPSAPGVIMLKRTVYRAGAVSTQSYSIWGWTAVSGFSSAPVNGILMPGRYTITLGLEGETAIASFSVSDSGRQKQVQAVAQAFKQEASGYQGAVRAIAALDKCCPGAPALTSLLVFACQRAEAVPEETAYCRRVAEGSPPGSSSAARALDKLKRSERSRKIQETSLERRKRATSEEVHDSALVYLLSGAEAAEAALQYAWMHPEASVLPEVLSYGYHRARDVGDRERMRRIGRLLVTKCPDSFEVKDWPSWEEPLLR